MIGRYAILFSMILAATAGHLARGEGPPASGTVPGAEPAHNRTAAQPPSRNGGPDNAENAAPTSRSPGAENPTMRANTGLEVDPAAGAVTEPAPQTMLPVRGGAAAPGAGTARAELRGADWIRTGLSLAGVTVLIFVLAWAYRSLARLSGWSGLPRMRSAGLIEVVARQILTPKDSLWLVRVGERMLLLGIGSQGPRALDLIADADAVSRLSGRAGPSARPAVEREFQRELQQQAAEFSEMSDPAAAKSTDPVKVRTQLDRTVERLRALSRGA